MQLQSLLDVLERDYPLEDADSWDLENVGLQVGSRDRDVHRIYLALDATEEVIADAVEKKADLLLTHHPMIFGGIRKVNTDTTVGRRILTLAAKDISYYAMHTNYDMHRMGALAAERISLKDAEILEEIYERNGQPIGYGRIGKLPSKMSVKDVCELIKLNFHLSNVKVFGSMQCMVERVAISPGSGKSMIDIALQKDAELLITGDIDHHDGIDARQEGLCIIDAGHYGLEHIFVEDMAAYLSERFPETEIIRAPHEEPFSVV